MARSAAYVGIYDGYRCKQAQIARRGPPTVPAEALLCRCSGGAHPTGVMEVAARNGTLVT